MHNTQKALQTTTVLIEYVISDTYFPANLLACCWRR